MKPPLTTVGRLIASSAHPGSSRPHPILPQTHPPGDLLDIIPAINLRATGSPGPHPTDRIADPATAAAMAPATLRAALEDRGHCSVLIRLTGDLGDLLMGHVAWFSFRCAWPCQGTFTLGAWRCRLGGGGFARIAYMLPPEMMYLHTMVSSISTIHIHPNSSPFSTGASASSHCLVLWHARD
jgi:hypothetical protein